MGNGVNACPFCGQNAKYQSIVAIPGDFVNCPTCGRYALSSFKDSMKDEIASFLYYSEYAHRPSSSFNDGPCIFLGEYKEFEKMVDSYPQGRYVSQEEIHAFYPRKFSDKIDRILLGLAEKSPYMGYDVRLTHSELISAFCIKRCEGAEKRFPEEKIKDQVDLLEDYLEENKLIDIRKYENFCIVTLLPSGWKRVDELQQHRKSDTVFIAMSFAPDMSEIREAIKQAITDNGFQPCILDEIEHNHQIVPEMLYQIRESRFVIAEFTNHNNGAYYEAGYALGLGKDVIHVCKKERFGQDGHFDIKQINTVLWENPDDLRVRLSARIQATIL